MRLYSSNLFQAGFKWWRPHLRTGGASDALFSIAKRRASLQSRHSRHTPPTYTPESQQSTCYFFSKHFEAS